METVQRANGREEHCDARRTHHRSVEGIRSGARLGPGGRRLARGHRRSGRGCPRRGGRDDRGGRRPRDRGARRCRRRRPPRRARRGGRGAGPARPARQQRKRPRPIAPADPRPLPARGARARLPRQRAGADRARAAWPCRCFSRPAGRSSMSPPTRPSRATRAGAATGLRRRRSSRPPRPGRRAAALRVYRFDPGDMRTQMHQEAFPGEDISDRPAARARRARRCARCSPTAHRAAATGPRSCSPPSRSRDANADGHARGSRSTLPPELEAQRAARGPRPRRRDAVRMLVARRGEQSVVALDVHAAARVPRPGRPVVVNTSGTIPAARRRASRRTATPVVVHSVDRARRRSLGRRGCAGSPGGRPNDGRVRCPRRTLSLAGRGRRSTSNGRYRDSRSSVGRARS